ncbi:hypothetical protein [Stenotrophomonas pictorum]|uniref:hypothetical protein n=1 Tax=Stenotrophomonas pictorum TaxID=86184 RepID=UPI000A9C2CEC|nr:hypothetical protein [Stenotrophomonas pictorum]
MNRQLFTKPAKRMKQPPKDPLREQLATAANEIIRLRAENEHMNQRMESPPGGAGRRESWLRKSRYCR